jgi:protein-disulfide isomerase
MKIFRNIEKKTMAEKAYTCVFLLALTLISMPAICEDTNTLPSQRLISIDTFSNHLKSADSKSIIQKTVKDYLLENPEIIAEAIVALQNKKQVQDKSDQKKKIQQLSSILKKPDLSTIIGNPNGLVTITEFFDYNCGFCKRMLPRILSAIKSNNNLQVILIELPILGSSSTLAAKAALAARAQGLYIPFHRNMMEYKGTLNSETINSIAKEVGLNINKLTADMDNPEIDERIERNKFIAEQLNISGTPAFIVGEEVVAGAISEKQLQVLLNTQTEKLK